jgi:hypothetical protein
MNDKYKMYDLLKAGVPVRDIICEYRLCDSRFTDMMREVMVTYKNIDKGCILGRRNEPYYECEEDYALVPTYDWSDLSLNEIEFYENKNN